MRHDRVPRRPPVSDWSDIRPGTAYGVPDVMALFGIGATTVYDWHKRGFIRALPRLSPRQPMRILGSQLLALLGEQGGAVPPSSLSPACAEGP